MASGPRKGEHPGSGNFWAKGPLEEMSVQGTESRPEQPTLAEAQSVRGMNLGEGQLERWAKLGHSRGTAGQLAEWDGELFGLQPGACSEEFRLSQQCTANCSWVQSSNRSFWAT